MRQRFCATCDEGIAYGRATTCSACKARRHAISAKASYRRAHAVQTRPCRDCGAPRARLRPGRCPDCAAIAKAARNAARPPVRKWTERARELHRMRAKAWRIVGPGEPARALVREWTR